MVVVANVAKYNKGLLRINFQIFLGLSLNWKNVYNNDEQQRK